MKYKYTSTSANLLKNILSFLFIIAFSLISIWVIKFSLPIKITSSVAVGIIAFLGYIHFKKHSFQITFYDDFIEVNYNYRGEKVKIEYSEIVKIRFASFQWSSSNTIYFSRQGKQHKFRFNSINDFLQFVKWLKTKNQAIEYEVLPSSHFMNYKLQEIYDFKSRK